MPRLARSPCGHFERFAELSTPRQTLAGTTTKTTERYPFEMNLPLPKDLLGLFIGSKGSHVKRFQKATDTK